MFFTYSSPFITIIFPFQRYNIPMPKKRKTTRKKKAKKKKRKIDWMLWQIEEDQHKDPPLMNLIRAIQYYTEKYGDVPNRVETPLGWSDGLNPPGGMLLDESKNVAPSQLRLTLDPSVNGGSIERMISRRRV